MYRAIRDLGGTVDPAQLPAGDHDPRVLVGMLEQAGIVRRGYDAGRAMRIELLTVDAGAGAVVDDLLARYAREATARVERIVRFAESTECRHAQVAEHFGETFITPCGACDICDPPASRAAQRAASPLPADVALAALRRHRRARFASATSPADDLRRVYRAIRDLGGTVDPPSYRPATTTRAFSSGCSSRPDRAARLRRRRAMRIELLTSAPEPERSSTTSRAMPARRRPRRAHRAIRREHRCRHAQVAEHFGETFERPAAPATSAIRPTSVRPALQPRRSHGRAGTIVRAVERLTWPLGRRSLVAMLRGSVSAPPSARASLAFGVLEAASDAEVKRWIKALEAAGALVEVETTDGFRVLNAVPDADLPSLGPKSAGPVDDSVVERLRSWRRERSREDGVPAYVVLHDATLRDLAAARPASLHELAAVKGFGPAKIERYGDDVLAVVASSLDVTRHARARSPEARITG